jgi:acyl carrier protein
LTRLRTDVASRDQLDIDSMDFLNFVVALHERLHVDIPESDYPKVATLSGCVTYLAARAR